MKKTDVQIGATYLVKVAGNLVPVKITREHDNGGWEGQSVKTGKTIRIKTAQRLRKPLDLAKKKRIVTKAEYEAEAAAEAATTAPVAKTSAKATKAATPATGGDTGERDATGAKPMSLLDAAAHLLSLGTGDPMRCKDIVDLAVARGLWARGEGKTPANSLYAAILREITTKGDTSRFVKAERGKFASATKV